MDDGVIGRWVAMVVSLVFYVGEEELVKVRGRPSGCGQKDGF